MWAIVKPESVRGSAANSAVSVALLGTGGRGSRVAGYAHANARGRVTALCDLFDDQIENAKRKIEVPNALVYKDFEKLLASDIDAVIIRHAAIRAPAHAVGRRASRSAHLLRETDGRRR